MLRHVARRALSLPASAASAASAAALPASRRGGAVRTAARWTGRAVVAGVVVAGGGGAAWVLSDADRRVQVQRTATFYRTMAPMYAHYRYVEWTVKGRPEPEREAAFDRLHDLYASQIFDLVVLLRGLYVKLGQIGAQRGDMMPQQYIDELSRLQDGVPPEDFAVIRAIIERDLKANLDDIFAWVDPVPLGAASIGQAHAARLRDGTEVVIKVQYPNVRQNFLLDFQTVRWFAELTQPEFNPIWDELERQFMTEFNFEREAAMQTRIRDSILPYFHDQVYIARVFDHLVTPHVIVMERIPGMKLVDGLKAQLTALAAAQGMTLEQLRKKMTAKPEDTADSGAPPPPFVMPSPFVMRMVMFYARARQHAYNLGVFLYNVTFGIFRGYASYIDTAPALNPARLLTTLSRVNAHTIFVDGAFNADQHPGNVLLMPDGRLGLIDFGQVKEMPEEHRYKFARLIVALAHDDRAAVVDEMRSMGFASKRNMPETLYLNAALNFDRDTQDIIGTDKNVQQFMEYLNELDPIEKFPSDYLMAGRCSLMLRGLGTMLAYPISTAKMWEPYATRLIQRHAAQA